MEEAKHGMSYCTAQRHTLQAQIKLVEKELERISADPLKEKLEQRLADLQSQLVTLGDCGD